MCQPGVYPTDVSDEEWAFLAPYLCLMKECAPQRVHSLRAVFNALRYLVRAGCPWRLLPNDLPPWQIVHQQATRWLKAGVFEAMVHDLRMILRLIVERAEEPTAVILPEAKRGFVLLPRRWVVERSFAWTARCRRLARDYERLSSTLAGLHFVAFAMLMLTRLLGGNSWKGI